jgi:outer membrane protein TolC
LTGIGRVRVVALVLAVSLPVRAADLRGHVHDAPGAAAPATLSAAVEAAWARYPRQKVLAARQEEADALADRAHSPVAGQPDVYARYQTDEAGSRDGLQEMELNLNLPVWRSGQRGAEASVAQASANAVSQSGRASMLVVAGEVRERVWEAALADNAAQLAEQALATARSLQKDLERQVAAGEASRADLLLARQEALARESALVQARAEALHARERYTRLTGLAELPAQRAETRVDRDEVPPDHPLLAESEAGVSEALTRLAAARYTAAGTPVVMLGAKRQRSDELTPYDNSVQVGVSVPIELTSQSRPAVAGAARLVGDAEASRETLLRELEGALDQARHELAATEERLVLAGEQARLARETLRLTRIAFQSGESDLVSLLRAQGQALAAERAQRQLELERLLGIARYNQALGELP